MDKIGAVSLRSQKTMLRIIDYSTIIDVIVTLTLSLSPQGRGNMEEESLSMGSKDGKDALTMSILSIPIL